jgi:hypothetical protein
VGDKSFARRRRNLRFCKFKYFWPQTTYRSSVNSPGFLFSSSFGIKNMSLLPVYLQLHLQGLIKLWVFSKVNLSPKNILPPAMKMYGHFFQKISEQYRYVLGHK